MAIELSTKTNVAVPDSDYPYGQIKDDTGAGDGTPVDVAVYGDFHQFFARMFALSGLTYNGLPDNDYSGFQYIEAANKLWKTFNGVKIVSGNTILTALDKHKLIIVSGAVASIDITLPSSTDLLDGDNINIISNSDYPVVIYRTSPDSIIFKNNSFVTLTLPYARDFVQFVTDKTNTDWYIANYQITKDTKISQEITLATQSTSSTTYVDMTGLTYTNSSSVSKKFKFTVKGDAELSAAAAINTAGCGGKVKILNDTTATDLDISRLEITIIVTGPTNDIVACLPINCQTIKTIAAGDTVKCQFLNDADGITVKEVKFLIEELEL